MGEFDRCHEGYVCCFVVSPCGGSVIDGDSEGYLKERLIKGQ